MSAVLSSDQRALQRVSPAWWQRLRTELTWRHGAAIGLCALALTLADLGYLVEKIGKPGVPLIIAFNAFDSVVLSSITLLAWMIAAGAGGTPRERVWRLAAVVVGSAATTVAITMPIGHWLGVHDIWMSLMDKKRAAPPIPLLFLSNTIQLSLFSFLFVLAVETLRRRGETQRAVQSAQREHASIAREVLESRLTAMQAQVEPQFLFDSLVDIEKLYRQDAVRAAGDLDRLITYLRVALPRLREPGSTIEAEIELVRAYLAVVTSLHGGRPTLTITLPEECRHARFYPMLLLPLLQRAVRHAPGALPESIKIGVNRIEQQIVIVLRFEVPDYCSEDPELARVRERLAGLFGKAASLDCHELAGVTQITMKIPASPHG